MLKKFNHNLTFCAVITDRSTKFGGLCLHPKEGSWDPNNPSHEKFQLT
jgi:hypothetical protein